MGYIGTGRACIPGMMRMTIDNVRYETLKRNHSMLDGFLRTRKRAFSSRPGHVVASFDSPPHIGTVVIALPEDLLCAVLGKGNKLLDSWGAARKAW